MHEIEVEPRIIYFGDSIYINLIITNDTSESFTVGSPNSCVYGYSIITPAGILVAPEEFPCFMSPTSITYEPGETVVHKMRWIWNDSKVTSGKYILFAGWGKYGQNGTAPQIEIELR